MRLRIPTANKSALEFYKHRHQQPQAADAREWPGFGNTLLANHTVQRAGDGVGIGGAMCDVKPCDVDVFEDYVIKDLFFETLMHGC